MYLKILILLLVFNTMLVKIESYKILGIYPVPSLSHQIVFRKLTLELIKQGHEVTVITTDPVYPKEHAPANLTEIDVHDLSYGALHAFFNKWDKSELHKKLLETTFFFEFFTEVCEIQFQAPQVQEILFKNKNQYDLILIEELARLYLGISHISNAPIILFSSFGGLKETHQIFGLQTHPFLYPSTLCRSCYNFSVWEKINDLYGFFYEKYLTYLNEDKEHKILQKYLGPKIPSIRELYQNVDMLFLNTHSIWAENQPVPPNVIHLGGFHLLEKKELPKDLKTYLDSSEQGVIYVSFGTNALSTHLPTDKVEILAKVLGQLPYDVLWKWDAEKLPGRSKNIKIAKWFPQADLLKHPKIKLFITQAGLQSTDEAISAGVPLIAFPILADQWHNAAKYVRHGIGKKILLNEFTEDVLKNAIETVIEDDSYRKNIINFRDLREDEPHKPLEKAMFWINHLIRHKGGLYTVTIKYDKVKDGQVKYDKVKYDQVKYDQVKYDQVKYDQVKYDQVKYDQVKYDQVKYDQVKYDQAKYDQVKYDQVKYDQAKYDQVKYDQVKYDHVKYDQAKYDQAKYDQVKYN